MKIKGFTLIELLIAVTISALIMSSVLIFTGDMIRASLKSEKVLNNQNKDFIFDNKFSEIINNISVDSIIASGSSFGNYETGIILYNKGVQNSLIYIGTKIFTGYCDSVGQNASATGTVRKLIIKELLPQNSHKISISGNYYIDLSKHSIYQTGGILLVGNENAGNVLGTYGTGTQLYNPNAIFETTSYIYISDSGNNRILSYEKANKNINIVANFVDGINNPTDIFYTGGELFIANTGNGNILKIKDSYGTGSQLKTKFKQNVVSIFDKIEFIFDGLSSISGPNSTSDFNFIGGINQYSGDSILTGNTLTYIFSGANLLNSNLYEININNIAPQPSTSGNYGIKINIYSGTTLVNTINALYYIKGDSTVATRKGNIIEIMSGGLIYPNNITGDINWDNNIHDWTGILNEEGINEVISDSPINYFGYKLNGKLLNIKYNFYKNYDCITDKHIIKEKNYIKFLK